MIFHKQLLWNLLLFRPMKDFSVSFSKAVVVGAVPILRVVQQYNASVSCRFSQPEVLSYKTRRTKGCKYHYFLICKVSNCVKNTNEKLN